MVGDEAAERASARMLEYFRELEMLVAMLVVEHGEALDEGGFRLHIDSEDAFRLRLMIGSTEPVVIKTFDITESRYVIDVL